MELQYQDEEALESMWMLMEEKGICPIPEDNLPQENLENVIKDLLQKGLIIKRTTGYELTELGKERGKEIVRRHRLAEKLFWDVLDVGSALAEETACDIEHFLRKDVEEKICTLLGHPTSCPHGKDIPPGQCCLRGEVEIEPIILPLCDIKPGETGIITHLRTENDNQMRKLINMGLLPGTKVALVRRFPSYIFRIGCSSFAVDKVTASQVYVRTEVYA